VQGWLEPPLQRNRAVGGSHCPFPRGTRALHQKKCWQLWNLRRQFDRLRLARASLSLPPKMPKKRPKPEPRASVGAQGQWPAGIGGRQQFEFASDASRGQQHRRGQKISISQGQHPTQPQQDKGAAIGDQGKKVQDQGSFTRLAGPSVPKAGRESAVDLASWQDDDDRMAEKFSSVRKIFWLMSPGSEQVFRAGKFLPASGPNLQAENLDTGPGPRQEAAKQRCPQKSGTMVKS